MESRLGEQGVALQTPGSSSMVCIEPSDCRSLLQFLTAAARVDLAAGHGYILFSDRLSTVGHLSDTQDTRVEL